MARPRRSSPAIKQEAGSLRLRQTEPEALLWAQLRDRNLDGIKFRRQHAIGRYIVDFCAPDQMLVVEVDGSQHIDRTAQDGKRTSYLELRGYRVVRFWNDQVTKDMRGVLESILAAAKGR